MRPIFATVPIFTTIVLAAFVLTARAQGDTLHVRSSDLDIKGLQTGNYDYIIIRKNNRESPAAGMILVNMTVEQTDYHGKPAIIVRQQWDRDSVVHKAYTVFDAHDFSTLFHDTYWKKLGYALVFDFENRKFTARTADRECPDSVRNSCEQELAASFGKYNLNWHDDLIIYSMLPYKQGRTFMINYYDPGFGKPAEVPYTVTGSDVLTDRGGGKIDCWVLTHEDDVASERFWIAKKNREVLKEEDHIKTSDGYRFKIKTGVSGI